VARQYDQAIEQARKTLELHPNYTAMHWVLGLAYVQKSMYKEGIAEFQKILVISPEFPYAVSTLGYAHALAGNRAEAQKVLNQLSKQKYVQALRVAAIDAGLGEKDEAIGWLEKAFDDRSTWDIKVFPVFDLLRSDPRFTDLLRRMNLQP
jgi:tetratricopeptide (TPR) repeat protein